MKLTIFKQKFWNFALLSALCSGANLGCNKNAPVAQPQPAAAVQPPGEARDDLTPEQRKAFDNGRVDFVRVYTPQTGLGPHFNDVACSSCHNLPTLGGNSDITHAARVVFAPPQIEGVWPKKTLPGFVPLQVPAGAKESMHAPPALYGLGLLEKIVDADLRDRCGKGGHVNVVFGNRIGRFGYKAHTATLRDFIADALRMEIGITNPVERDQRLLIDIDAVQDPEQPTQTIDHLVEFVSGLAAPPPLPPHLPGQKIFSQIGCADCHRPDVTPQVLGAYTDLCLHDMGAAFDNGIVDFSAKGSEWKTAALWGIRHRTVYFHDHRTADLAAAIRLHGGDAQAAAAAFQKLPDTQQADLLKFLRTL